jgi:hypothetical protein
MRKHAEANDSCLSIRQTPKAAIVRSFFFGTSCQFVSAPQLPTLRPTLRSPLKEVHYVVRTVAFIASLCPAVASGHFIVLLCAARQSATRNGFVAVGGDAPAIGPAMITDILQMTRISLLFLLRVIVFFLSVASAPAGFTHDS